LTAPPTTDKPTARSASPDPRVLQITSIDSTLVVLLWAQLRALRVQGYDVRTACSCGPNRQWLRDHGIPCFNVDIRRAISPWSDLKALCKLYAYMRRERISIVHTHTPKAALLGQLAAKLARVPLVINTLHGFYFHDDMRRFSRWFYIALAWIGGRCANLTLSQNREDISTAIRLGVCKPSRIRFLGNGVDLDRFNPDRFDDAFRHRKRTELNIDNDKLIIGMLGRLVVDKGYLELFDAIRELSAERDDFHLLIIGPQERSRAGRIAPSAITEYGIADRVTHLSARNDVEELMACMDLFVLPSWREGFPRSAIEAAAMRLPIVTTNIRGCREVVTHGENGLLVPPRDATALASAIRSLLDDADARQRMGAAGFDRARRDFDEQIICDRVMNAYNCHSHSKALQPPTPRPDLNRDLPQRGPFAWGGAHA